MLTKREFMLSKVMVAFQVIITVGVLFVPEHLLGQSLFSVNQYLVLILQIILLWGWGFEKLKLGIIFRESSFIRMISGYSATAWIGTLLMLAEELIWPHPGRHKAVISFFILFGVIDVLALILFKYGFYKLMHFVRRNGYNSRHSIIIADSTPCPFLDNFVQSKDWGYRLMAILTPDSGLTSRYALARVVTTHTQLVSQIINDSIDDVFYCLPINDTRHYNLQELIRECSQVGVSVHIMQSAAINNLFRANTNKTKEEFNAQFEVHQTIPKNYTALKTKHLFDLNFSTLVLILLSPIMALIAILIKLEDGGPVFFKQERIGRNGRRFNCLKFRSMVVNAESKLEQLKDKNEADGPVFKIANDPRITKIGHFLRKTSLDELPQFINVVRGEMSVVGPRPPLLKEVEQYERSQLRRLSMRPGITGSWQVWGRHLVTFNDWMKMDLDYIDKWSILLDLKIMVSTAGVIIKAKGQ